MNSKQERHGLLITAVGLGILLNPLNTTMISVALARLQQYFEVSYQEISWLIASFYLASAIANPIMGKLGDSYGRKKFFILGLTLVTISSIAAPFSSSFGMLLVCRTIQAVGASAVNPSGMGVIRQMVGARQARALGILAVFSSSSAALGPSIGGLLLSAGDWPALFMINFPIILASFILAMWKIPSDAKIGGQKPKIDIWGMFFFSAFVCCFLMFLLSLNGNPSWWALAGIIASFFIFYRIENRSAEPFINLNVLIRNMGVMRVNVHYILTNLTYYSLMFSIPMYIQSVYELSPSESGLIMLSLALPSVLAGPVTARLIERTGVRTTIIAGSIISLMGGIFLSLSGASASLPSIMLSLVLFGYSTGTLNVSLQQALFLQVSKRDTGVASGLFMNARFFGSMMSSSLLGFVFHDLVSPSGLHLLALFCAGSGVLMLILASRVKSAARALDGE